MKVKGFTWGGAKRVNLHNFGSVEVKFTTPNCGFELQELPRVESGIFYLSGGVLQCFPVAAVDCESRAKTSFWWKLILRLNR